MSENTLGPYFSNKVYDRLKLVAQIVLPAIASLYFCLSSVFDLPAVIEVVGSLSFTDTFLGALLVISSKQYIESGAAYDGEFVVEADGGGMRNVLLVLDGDPEELIDKEVLSFKIRAKKVS